MCSINQTGNSKSTRSFLLFSLYTLRRSRLQQHKEYQRTIDTMSSPSSSSSSGQLSLRATHPTSHACVVSTSALVLERETDCFSATTSTPAECHYYEPLKDEPSTKKVLQRHATSRRGSAHSHQDVSRNHCLPAPRQSELHLFAFVEDILHQVERELQAEAAPQQQGSRQENQHSLSSNYRRHSRMRRRSGHVQ